MKKHQLMPSKDGNDKNDGTCKKNHFEIMMVSSTDIAFLTSILRSLLLMAAKMTLPNNRRSFFHQRPKKTGFRALVISPTRELAQQVCQKTKYKLCELDICKLETKTCFFGFIN